MQDRMSRKLGGQMSRVELVSGGREIGALVGERLSSAPKLSSHAFFWIVADSVTLTLTIQAKVILKIYVDVLMGWIWFFLRWVSGEGDELGRGLAGWRWSGADGQDLGVWEDWWLVLECSTDSFLFPIHTGQKVHRVPRPFSQDGGHQVSWLPPRGQPWG